MTTADTHNSAAFNHKELMMLHRISLMLIKDHDFNKLFGKILDSAIVYTNAEGATIYMVDEDNNTLKFIKVFNSRLKVSMGSEEINWPPVNLFKEDGEENLNNLAALCYHRHKSFNFPDVYEQNTFDSSGTKDYDLRNGYRTKSIVAIPMVDHKSNVIGVIQLINALDNNHCVIPFNASVVKNLEILTSISAILLNNHKLIIDLQTSFNQFIKAIAWAIDRKSKHFSGHIARVSELVNSFAEKINEYQGNESKFGRVHFSDDELEEIKIAGLMHDIGKIITPMHILDKSSKLEKIFDRIELVQERIDHLKTKVEFAFYQKNLTIEGKNDYYKNLEEFEQFLIRINKGREFLSDQDLEYLQKIKDYILKINGKEYSIITDDEFYNLKIRRGTLNQEDLDIIREHAYVTGKVLSQIKFPQYIQNAPLFAEQHHEKLNGKGYPNGLDASQIPLQSRILAIADVFEALTAVRPYKESKKLTETYSILRKMIENCEIDADLFDFAILTGLFQEYAHHHLRADLIDTDK